MNNILSVVFSSSFLFSIFRVVTPILYPSLGAIISNKAGVPNIGLEGVMLMSSLAGVIGSAFSGNAWAGLICAILMSFLMTLLLAYFTLNMETNVIMGGIALNLFASGASVFILFMITGDKGTSSSLASKILPAIEIPLIKDIPFLGEVISGHNILTYVAVICVIGLYYMLKKTPLGQKIKAVGENADAAASVGINVRRTKYIALLLSGLFCGLGGAFMSMGYVSWFSADMTAGRGWIALAAEATGQGSVIGTVLSSLLFGVAQALYNALSLFNLPSELVSIIPYAATVIALVIYGVMNLRKVHKKY